MCSRLQWLHGLLRLGHDVYLVEKANYPDACFDPSVGAVGNDGSYGMAVISTLLAKIGVENRLCFVDCNDNYYGLSKAKVQTLFDTADLYVDYGNHGAWLPEAARSQRRVLVDGEPGYRQIQLAKEAAEGRYPISGYDHYYTVGLNVSTPESSAPIADLEWKHLFHPVSVDLFDNLPAPRGAPFTTVMNWQSHRPIEYHGTVYGQKDIEFEKFMSLPRLINVPLEVAVAGREAPLSRLLEAGWRVRQAHEVTLSYESFLQYVSGSRGEFSVCKNVFVATNSGWFSDRSAAYLAAGRPVVLQETGFSAHLPCGSGLFAVRSVDEAGAAIEAIDGDYQRHSRWARELAREYLDAEKVLGRFLRELGL
jgi:hypothetical protein